jgi:hypothetical protein
MLVSQCLMLDLLVQVIFTDHRNCFESANKALVELNSENEDANFDERMESALNEITNLNADAHVARLKKSLIDQEQDFEELEELELTRGLNYVRFNLPRAETGVDETPADVIYIPDGELGNVVKDLLLASRDPDKLTRTNEIHFDEVKRSHINVYGKRLRYSARQHDTHLRELVST